MNFHFMKCEFSYLFISNNWSGNWSKWPRFWPKWLRVLADTKKTITIKLHKELVELLPESTSDAKIMNPDDPKDFYSSLRRKQSSSITDPLRMRLLVFFWRNKFWKPSFSTCLYLNKAIICKIQHFAPWECCCLTGFFIGGKEC